MDAIIITILVLLSVTIDFIQTYRSQKAEEWLRTQVAATASVLRDGTWSVLPRAQLVPGDIIRLSAGDLVPADARLLDATELHVLQAALTGESFPAEKDAADCTTMSSSPAESSNIVLMGTSAASGSGTAEVIGTGRSTAFGDIAERQGAKPPETGFDRGIRQFSLLMARTVIFLVLFVLVFDLALKRENPLQTLLFAVALAVGLEQPLPAYRYRAAGCPRQSSPEIWSKRCSTFASKPASSATRLSTAPFPSVRAMAVQTREYIVHLEDLRRYECSLLIDLLGNQSHVTELAIQAGNMLCCDVVGAGNGPSDSYLRHTQLKRYKRRRHTSLK